MSKKRAVNSVYPSGYLKESQEPSVVRRWVDGAWVEIPYYSKSFTDYSLKKVKKEARRKRKGKNKGKRKFTPVTFYDSRAWKKLRLRVFKAYFPICMKCGGTKILQVDHIKPRSLFPELELRFNNMQILCRECNMEKSNKNCIDYRGRFAELDIVKEANKRI